MKYTKGPWKIRESGGCVCSNNKTICQLIEIDDGALSITPEVAANARLISKAPDLLQCCIDSLTYLSTVTGEIDEDCALSTKKLQKKLQKVFKQTLGK